MKAVGEAKHDQEIEGATDRICDVVYSILGVGMGENERHTHPEQ